MSVQAITWALGFAVENASEKAILLVLANYADGTGACFPGQESIAEQAACSERTVRRVLEAFEERGVIARQERRRRDGSRTSDAIVLLPFRQAANLSGSAPATGQSVQTNRPICPSLPDTVSGLTTFEPSEEPSEEEPASPPALAEHLWRIAHQSSRTRSGRKDVRSAVRAALAAGATPAALEASVRALSRDDYAKGLHRIIQGEHWRDHLAKPSTPVDPELAAHRLTHFRKTGEWKPTWGPRPMDEAA